jgi:prefoldin subunit 5
MVSIETVGSVVQVSLNIIIAIKNQVQCLQAIPDELETAKMTLESTEKALKFAKTQASIKQDELLVMLRPIQHVQKSTD